MVLKIQNYTIVYKVTGAGQFEYVEAIFGKEVIIT